jgi:hypothetical protein
MLVEREELSWLKEAKNLSPRDLGWSTQAAMGSRQCEPVMAEQQEPLVQAARQPLLIQAAQEALKVPAVQVAGVKTEDETLERSS